MVFEKDNILDIIQKARKALKSRDALLLKDLSNRTVHSASINQDVDSITTAVIVFALFKLVERPDYANYKDWSAFAEIVDSNLGKAASDLSKDKLEQFRKHIFEIRKAEEKLSDNLKKYIAEVFRKAMVSKASRIYEHGISMEATASLLGITVFELAEYAGKTGISDVDLNITKPISKRLEEATNFFG